MGKSYSFKKTNFIKKENMQVYIASSFKNVHAVRLLGKYMRQLGYTILDWTEKATPPDGLNSSQRREWMDTDHGGEVFNFCAKSCMEADFLIYLGTSGQDAGVELGIAYALNIPILGIKGPLESAGLMLHGVITAWVEHIDHAQKVLEEIMDYKKSKANINNFLEQTNYTLQTCKILEKLK